MTVSSWLIWVWFVLFVAHTTVRELEIKRLRRLVARQDKAVKEARALLEHGEGLLMRAQKLMNQAGRGPAFIPVPQGEKAKA